ncbi:DUF2147 domain-containing protein [Algoriphagus sediminis]|uniref:DUF2147 domain-containing protein n=1 Tax=Algoriphagus sediminis TaxID=3057113 RepID=A0ABT7YD89_9BACT|nr:DUF2147 domain-containing protein [Algoriphagus sediminis]MDN3204482.1 DUF2147 domain-containing protein [Algoriphagus sediminis]
MKTPIALFLSLFFLGTSQIVRAQNQDAILGTWWNTEKSAKIEIIKNDDVYLGKIIFLTREENGEGPFLDTENSDPDLRDRPLMGLSILSGLKYNKGAWEDGEIYDPESGKTYSCEVKLEGEDKLKVKGYIGVSWVGRTVEWTRIK